MASVYQVDALIRQRPGISLDELRKALGPDIQRPLKRLEVLGYIRRVESSDRSISCSVIALLGAGRRRRVPRAVVFFPLERPGSPDSERPGRVK
jgi:DNA-binding MarR family transcriptional regulator